MKITTKKIFVLAFIGGLVYLYFRGKKSNKTTQQIDKKEGTAYILKQDFKKEEINIPLNKRITYEFKKGDTIIGGISPIKDTRFKADKDSIATTKKGTLPNFDNFAEDWVEIPITYLEKK
jgi:hypothetical protein